MKKKETRKLRLNSETVKRLDVDVLGNKQAVVGGHHCTDDCNLQILSECSFCPC